RPGRAAATLARIANGRRQHGDRFLIPYYASGSGLTGRSLDRPIGTITTRDRWAVIDGDRMRMITVAEGRRAMTIPPDYKMPAANKDSMFLLGNAVPPLGARRFVEALRKAA
ncbi:DNA cytosine methyltransferase, partial [Rhodanobacter denitrificans]|nr:DNA cytosine methyltransferase [Rhodanobacter denitrificans]